MNLFLVAAAAAAAQMLFSRLLELDVPTFPSWAGGNPDLSEEHQLNQNIQTHVVLWGKRSLI